MMICRHKQIFDIILIDCLHPLDTFTATVLALKVVAGHTLNVAKICHSHYHVIIRYQIFCRHIIFIISDCRSSLISIFIRNDDDFFSDYAEQLFLVCQNSL